MFTRLASQSGKDKKFHSLQRKKKDKRSNSPSESDTSESTRDNQSNVSLTPSAVSSDNITPNSRRKGIVNSRVITSDEYFTEQVILVVVVCCLLFVVCLFVLFVYSRSLREDLVPVRAPIGS